MSEISGGELGDVALKGLCVFGFAHWSSLAQSGGL
jgi:hypothetical protein